MESRMSLLPAVTWFCEQTGAKAAFLREVEAALGAPLSKIPEQAFSECVWYARRQMNVLRGVPPDDESVRSSGIAPQRISADQPDVTSIIADDHEAPATADGDIDSDGDHQNENSDPDRDGHDDRDNDEDNAEDDAENDDQGVRDATAEDDMVSGEDDQTAIEMHVVQAVGSDTCCLVCFLERHLGVSFAQRCDDDAGRLHDYFAWLLRLCPEHLRLNLKANHTHRHLVPGVEERVWNQFLQRHVTAYKALNAADAAHYGRLLRIRARGGLGVHSRF